MRRGLLGVGVAVLVGALAPEASSQDWEPWENVIEEDGIRLDSRRRVDTGVIQIRGTVELPCSTRTVWDWITTPQSYLEIMPGTLASVHLEETEGRVIVYQRLDASPSSDRDYTLDVRFTVDDREDGEWFDRAWSVANELGPPPKKGVVRVEVNEGTWKLRPLGVDGCRLLYDNYIELGGRLWTRLANGGARDSAEGFLRNLRQRCSP